MAFWQRKKNGHIFVYYMEDGKQKTTPRAKTKHLDAASDSNINSWMAENYGAGRAGPKTTTPEKLARLVEQYLTYLKEDLGRNPSTLHTHKQSLYDFIIPYMVTHCETPEPELWGQHTAKLAPWLRAKKESEHRVARVNATMRGFWSYLRDEGVVSAGVEVRLRPSRIRDEPTPLRITLVPEEILNCPLNDPRIRLLALLGYFFSLRPQESFGLRVSDFRAGSKADPLECCRIMKRANLFSRFAVHITRQRTQSGDTPVPKSYSKGWVACFNERAAREVVTILKKLGCEPDELIFKEWQNDWWFELWSRHGVKSVSLKDLRRASLYYLGHHTDMDFVGLRGHARHRKAETTLWYIRRPEEEVDDEVLDLDLDA